MFELNQNDKAIANFTMLGHSLVHWFETSIPIFLVVWLGEFPETSVAVFGIVVALGYAPFGLGALPAGILADQYGPKRMVLFCVGGMSIAFFLLAFARSVVTILLALILWGVAASVYHPSGLALISTGAEERGSVFAYHGIAGNVGIALGPFVTATLLMFGLQWQTVAAVLAVPGLIGIVYGFYVTFDPAAATEADDVAASGEAMSLSELVSNSRQLFMSAFALVFLIVTFEGLFYRGVLTYLPEILHEMPAIAVLDLPTNLEGIEPADYIYVGLLIIGISGQYVGGKLTDRVSAESGLAALFLLFAALAIVFIPASTMGLGTVIILCAALGFVLFAIQPFYQEAVAIHTPPDTRGLSYGFTYLGEFGLGATSIALGGLALGFDRRLFFILLAGFATTGLLLTVGLSVAITRYEIWQRRVAAKDS